MMKRPKRLDFTPEEVEALIGRIENQSLEVSDFPLFADLVKAMLWMEGALREKSLSIKRLKAIFGVKTESAKRLKSLLKPEKLRCPTCGQIFTAKLPANLYTESRIDKTAKAIVSILKYRGGMPFYRQEQIQTILGNPISDTEIWGMTRDVADCMEPIFVELCRLAANGECLHNDDTTAKVLSLMKENKEVDPKRKGIFTTGILGKVDDKQIALFFTGRQHAGENLNDLLVYPPKTDLSCTKKEALLLWMR